MIPNAPPHSAAPTRAPCRLFVLRSKVAEFSSERGWLGRKAQGRRRRRQSDATDRVGGRHSRQRWRLVHRDRYRLQRRQAITARHGAGPRCPDLDGRRVSQPVGAALLRAPNNSACMLARSLYRIQDCEIGIFFRRDPPLTTVWLFISACFALFLSNNLLICRWC